MQEQKVRARERQAVQEARQRRAERAGLRNQRALGGVAGGLGQRGPQDDRNQVPGEDGVACIDKVASRTAGKGCGNVAARAVLAASVKGTA